MYLATCLLAMQELKVLNIDLKHNEVTGKGGKEKGRRGRKTEKKLCSCRQTF